MKTRKIVLDIPHIEQSGGEKANRAYWKKRTCGLACIKMFLQYSQGKSPSFDELIQFNDKDFVYLSLIDGSEKKYKYFSASTGWIHYGLISIAREYSSFGISDRSYTKENFIEKFENQLNIGYFIVASVNRYPEYKKKRRGHLIVITGVEKVGNKTWIIVNDPAKKIGKSRITLKTFMKNFNWTTIILSTSDEEWFGASYPISIEVTSAGKSGKTYIHLHGNEKLALDVTNKYVMRNGGELLSLKQNQERFIRYQIDSTEGEKVFLRVDPNRIFTDEGLKETLIGRNSHLIDKDLPIAVQKGEYIRDYVLSKLADAQFIVGVHNNKLLNINDYKDSGNLVRISPSFPLNAFVVTYDMNHFKNLSEHEINVVYLGGEDDAGSLGQYLKSAKKQYITIETGYDDEINFNILLNAVSELDN